MPAVASKPRARQAARYTSECCALMATIYLTLAAKANAFLHGRGHVVPQDVKEMALNVLRHRVILTYEAEAEEKTSDEVIRTILDKLPVP